MRTGKIPELICSTWYAQEKMVVACVSPKGAKLCYASVIEVRECGGNSSGCVRDAGVSPMNN